MKLQCLPPFSVMCSFHRLISPPTFMFLVHIRKRKAKDEIPEVKQLIIPRTHDSHMHETVHKFYFPYHKITMASLRLLYVLSHSLSLQSLLTLRARRVSAICANVYVWWWNEWVERSEEKCKWESFVYSGGWFSLPFRCPPHVVCTHKFSNPLFCADSALLLLLILFRYLLCPPSRTIHSVFSVFGVLVTLLALWNRKLSTLDTLQLCMGFELPSTEHVENIINFISYGLTPPPARCPHFPH